VAAGWPRETDSSYLILFSGLFRHLE
jgi:hypothetical protein